MVGISQREGEERILSAKKREKFLSNLAKKPAAQSKPGNQPFLFMPNRQNSDVSVKYKRSTSCFFYLFSSLKDKMHFTCRTRCLANASGQMGNFTPLDLRKIEFYG